MTKPDFSEMIERYLPDHQEARRRELLAAQGRHPTGSSLAGLPIQARCDLHGQTADQARRSVDRFLKDCANRGFRKVLIIHGKGEGVLKGAVISYLEGHPLAGQRVTAPQADGGKGALVVIVREKNPAPESAV